MEEAEIPPKNRSVKKRAVCYIPGYDPRGPKFYHRMFKRESSKQAKISNYEVNVGKITIINDRVAKWAVEHIDKDGLSTETDYYNLNYDNLIKANWEKNTFQIYFSVMIGIWTFLRNGMFVKGWKMGWPTMLTLIIPMLISLIQITLILSAVWGFFVVSCWHLLINIVLFLFVIAAVYWLGDFFEKKFNFKWLVRTYRFLTYQRYPKLPEIMKAFREQLLALDKTDEYEEIIVVGHSMGTILAVDLIDDVLKEDTEFGLRKAEVNMITLGTAIALIAGINENTSLNEALHRLKDEKRIDWLEFSAKVDGANVFMKHPLCLSKNWDESPKLPRLFPARFFKCFSPEEYKKLRNDRLRLHFQYVLAQEQAGEYDYFKMVTGVNFLRDSFPESDNS